MSRVFVFRCPTLPYWILCLHLVVVMVTSASSTTSQVISPSEPTSELTSSMEATSGLNLTSSPIETTSANSSNLTSPSTSESNLTSNAVTDTKTSTAMLPPVSTTSKSPPTNQRQTSAAMAPNKGALSEEGQLGIIITCVLVGTGLVIAAVAFLTRFFNKQKTLTYEQRTNVANGFINKGSSIEDDVNAGTHPLRGNASSTSLKTAQSV